MANKITTISGIPAHTAKKVCRYAFRDHFSSLVLNQVNASYDVMLYEEVDGKKIDKTHLKDFKDFWGNSQWRLYFVSDKPK